VLSKITIIYPQHSPWSFTSYSGVARNFQLGVFGGGLGAEPPALEDFCNFSLKTSIFMHISTPKCTK